jgi:hypothetical protein
MTRINSLTNAPTTIVNNYTTQVLQAIVPSNTESGNTIQNTQEFSELMNGKGKNTITTMEELESKKLEIYNTIRDSMTYITNLVNNGTQLIQDFVALQVTAVYGYFDEIWTKQVHTDSLIASGATIDTIQTKDVHMERFCIKKSNGTEICLNGDQIESLMGNTPVVTTMVTQNSSTTEMPVIESVSGEIQNIGEPIIESNTGEVVTNQPEVTPEELPIVIEEST